jgi:hypothetical protein
MYRWASGFREVFISSAYYVQLATAIFIVFPLIFLTYACFRNRKLIAAGVVHVDTDSF